MKGIFALVLCTALMMPIAIHAGDGHRGNKGKHAQKAHKFSKELNLTDAQREQMKAINQETKTQRKAIKEMPEADRKAAMQKLRADRKAKTSAILRPEQRQKLDELKAAHKDKKG